MPVSQKIGCAWFLAYLKIYKIFKYPNQVEGRGGYNLDRVPKLLGARIQTQPNSPLSSPTHSPSPTVATSRTPPTRHVLIRRPASTLPNYCCLFAACPLSFSSTTCPISFSSTSQQAASCGPTYSPPPLPLSAGSCRSSWPGHGQTCTQASTRARSPPRPFLATQLAGCTTRGQGL